MYDLVTEVKHICFIDVIASQKSLCSHCVISLTCLRHSGESIHHLYKRSIVESREPQTNQKASGRALNLKLA